MKLTASPVKALAQSYGLPILQPARLKTLDAQAALVTYPADVMVVAAYGLILPRAVLDFPRLGCINIHASLLPRWRGAAPIQRALLAGDAETGVSIMQMDTGLDTGPVLAQAHVPVAFDETAASLHDKLAAAGAIEIVRVLQCFRDGVPLFPQPQSELGVTYANKVEPAEGRIDWHQPAQVIDRQIRAFNPPGASTMLGGAICKIWRARFAADGLGGSPGTIVDAGPQVIVVACGSGSLGILELQLAGGKRLTAQAFLAGHRLSSGDRFGEDNRREH